MIICICYIFKKKNISLYWVITDWMVNASIKKFDIFTSAVLVVAPVAANSQQHRRKRKCW